MAILHAIIEAKKREALSLPTNVMHLRVPKDFVGALLQPHRPSLIAEVKPKSPSQGVIFPRDRVPFFVEIYNAHADAISVLCDEFFFGGGYDLLREVRSLTEKPILAKEFIIDPKQIHCTAAAGADAVLFIAAILTTAELRDFCITASDLGLGCLVEVHSAAEVQKVAEVYNALPQAVQKRILLGINNRNLDTLEIDLSVTEALAPLIRKTMPTIRGIIAESGIGKAADIQNLRMHVQGFLIGTSILRSENPALFLDALFPQKVSVKFCGMTNSEDIAIAERLHADFIGFIFVPSSPRAIDITTAENLRVGVHEAKIVGVFTDMTQKEIQQYITRLRLDYIQLHGVPNLDLCSVFSVPVIQAFWGVPSVDTLDAFLAVCPYVLIDKEKGKEEADFKAIASLPAHIRSRVFLAGGLKPSTVRVAVEMIHPFAVDIARGIEVAPGKKDPVLMTSFLSALAP